MAPQLFEKAIAVPISGLVITFRSSVIEHFETIEALRRVPEIDIGLADGSKLAIVVDSASKYRDQEIWHMVQQLPGVVELAVAMVAFDDGNSPAD